MSTVQTTLAPGVAWPPEYVVRPTRSYLKGVNRGLTIKQIRDVRRERGEGLSYDELVAKYQMGRRALCDVINGRRAYA
jgi:hypothetical protein